MSKRQELTDTMRAMIRDIGVNGGTIHPRGYHRATCRALADRGYVEYVRETDVSGHFRLTAYGRDWLKRHAP